MAVPILATKLYIPPPRPKAVLRPRLIERLQEAHTPGVTLISAPAGFGKTTLLSNWIITLTPSPLPEGEGLGVRVAWLSLDEGDNDPKRFLAYLVAALQTIRAGIGEGILAVLQSPQPPATESVLTTLLNEMTAIPREFVLILDDYHVIDSKVVNAAVGFLLEHLPPEMHLVIATREDPSLPLAKLRARGQLTELRASDLRFTLAEASEFLDKGMGLKLSPDHVNALEARTEGWIAGLQLAALSMQGQRDAASFIQSFSGGHHFIMDYLVQEVLQGQPENIQTFLLRTSILERLSGPLCDAVLLDASTPGQETLEYLERANLFIVPLDNERRWYRYHHLFAELLRQRLQHSLSSTTDGKRALNELHLRASAWYEEHGLDLEAFQHAAAADDIARAERIIEGRGIPLHFRGAITPILDWLESLPASAMDARPSLWWRHAAMLLINGQTVGVGEKLQAAETALQASLQGREPDTATRNLIGQIATARATLALTRYDVEGMLTNSRRALDYLYPEAQFNRATATWTMGFACSLLGERTAARQAFSEAIALSQAARAPFSLILAMLGLGTVQEVDIQLHEAAATYRHVIQLVGEHAQQVISEAHLGMARIHYEWNDLDPAEEHGQRALQLALQYENIIDRFVICEVFLARLKLAQGDLEGAAELLAKTDEAVRKYNFVLRAPEVAALQVLTLLRQGQLDQAAHVAQAHKLPLSQARVHLAQGDAAAALTVLEPYRRQVEAKDWKDERLRALILQSLALQARHDDDQALQVLVEALGMAEPGGFIRIFIDEGDPMARLLLKAPARGLMPGYVGKLLAAFEAEAQKRKTKSTTSPAPPATEPLTPRELEVLRLVAEGLSNEEIGRRLFLALDTVKGHNRRIYDKLQVQRRTEAVARARALGLL